MNDDGFVLERRHGCDGEGGQKWEIVIETNINEKWQNDKWWFVKWGID